MALRSLVLLGLLLTVTEGARHKRKNRNSGNSVTAIVDKSAGISEETIEANGLTFRGIYSGRDAGSKGNVLFLHGFPFNKDFWRPLMDQLAAEGWYVYAYDQRGYSPGAAPDDVEQYHYDILRSDVFAVADALGWEKFHLVTHDHGAVLGYHTVASDAAKDRVLTFTALSVPHPMVFSDAVVGDHIVEGQEMSSQYFQMFVEKNSARVGGEFLFKTMGKGKFDSPDAMQKALFWYNGARAANVLAFPRLHSLEEMKEKGASPFLQMMRQAFSETPDKAGAPAKGVGHVPMPFLFGTGKKDTAVRGAEPWGRATKNYADSTYTEVITDAGHDMVTPSEENKDYQVLYDAIKLHLEKHNQ